MKALRLIAALAAMITAAIVASCAPSTQEPDARAAYQTKLDQSPNRFDAGSQITANGGRLYVAKSITQTCPPRCGVIEQKDANDPLSGYKVYLPIGFQIAKNNPSVHGSGLVTELVYWDPVQHREVSVPYTHNQAVKLPDSLVRRSIDALAVGQTGYIQGAYVQPTPEGDWLVAKNAPLWHEPVGLQYNMTVEVRITRTKEGLEICAPQHVVLSTTTSTDGLSITSISHSC